ncbi:MAG: hypothetical protein O2826_05185 [Chloroflexi bacterium]|nr:hypothetical protein [Chloroflexota bacterium]
MARILAAAGDPGGAAALLPVMRALVDAGHELTSVAGQPAARMFADAGFACVPSTGSWADHTAMADATIASNKPDLALVATGMLAGVDAALVRTGKRAGIPTVCVLDAWVNYRERFMGPNDTMMLPSAIPDLITVMDDFTVREMVDLGFPPAILRVVGQPAFDAWVERSSSPAWARMRDDARRELSVSDDERLVVFFSQPLDNDYGSPGSPRYRGYDQRTAFAALQHAIANLDPRPRLVIKPHPREPVGAYEQVEAGAIDAYRVVPSQGQTIGTDSLTAGADLLVSMTSVTLVQAMLAGTPIISLQPDLGVEDTNVLGRMGIRPPVTDVSALPQAIMNALGAGAQDVQSLLPETWTDGKSTARTVAAIEHLVKG